MLRNKRRSGKTNQVSGLSLPKWPGERQAYKFDQIIKGEGQASGRNGRFINQKRTSGEIPSFGLRMADFILSRMRSLSAARPSNF